MKKQLAVFAILAVLSGNCEEAPDFSAAFDAMWSLGVAEFKEGLLVKAEPQIDADSIRESVQLQMMSMGREGLWPRLQGSGSQPEATHWLIDSNRAGGITLLGAFGRVTRGYDAAAVQKVPAGENLPSFKIKVCDLKKDAALVERALDNVLTEKEEQAGKKRQSYRLRMMQSDQSQLLYALTAMYKAGHQEDAGRLAQKLLKSSDDPEEVISGVIGQMGMLQYQEIMSELSAGRSTFAAAVKKIDTLLERFGEEWKGYDAARSIRDDMARYDRTKPPAEIPGISAQEQQLAKDLVTGISITNQFERDVFALCGSSDYNWLYDAPVAAKAAERSVILRIVAGGIKSIPLLAAMCEEQTLTALMRGGEGDFSSLRMMRHSFRSDSGTEKMQRQELPGPMTRGEFAVALLSGVVPQAGAQDNPYARRGQEAADPAEVKKSALDFYNKNKDKSPVELAFSQLQNSEKPDESAFLFVARASQTDEALARKIEALLLEQLGKGDDDSSSFALLALMRIYCRIKGEAAADFVHRAGVKMGLEVKEGAAVDEKPEKVAAADEMYASKSVSGQDYARKMQEQHYKSLKQMTVRKDAGTAKPGDFKAVLDTWGTKKIDRENYMELTSTAQDLSLMISGGADVVAMYGDVLDAALKVSDAGQRANYIMLMGVMMLAERMKEMPAGMFGLGGRAQERSKLEAMLAQSEGDTEEQPKQPELSPSAYKVSLHAEKWRKLVQDDRPFPDLFGQGSMTGVETMGDMVLLMLCQMNYANEFHSLMGLPPQRVSKLLRAAGEHILQGKEAGEFKWPESGALADEDLGKLAARVKQLKPEEVQKFLEQDISDSEYIAMERVIAADQSLIAVLAPYAAQIRSVDITTNVAGSVAGVTKKFKNQKMSAALLKQAHTALCRDVDLVQGQDTTITLMRSGGWLNGWSVKASASAGEDLFMSSLKDMLGDDVDLAAAKKNKIIFISFTDDGDQCICRLAPDGVLSLIDGEEFAGIKGEEKADLWKALDSVINGQGEQFEEGYAMPVVINLYLP